MRPAHPSTSAMELIIWRHAEAAEATALVPDLKRRLTTRGEKQARAVAKWLRERQPKHLHILVSPALRCQQTAHALALAFDTDKRLAPGADVSELLAATGWGGGGMGRGSSVLLVGHQPTLGRLAALLLSGEEADWTIKKGGLWWISQRSREDEAQTTLRAVISPELL